MKNGTNITKLINSVNEISEFARKAKVCHLSTNKMRLEKSNILIEGKHMINFGSCSYLGLELDKRLKKASINAINRYGTQFSSSRAYLSLGLYDELEELLASIFSNKVLLAPNTTMGHQAVMSTIISERDMVIFDHQCHYSMQELKDKLQSRGTTITQLRHNNLEELEKKIDTNKNQYNKIWYFIDGVYSMYGDVAPLRELEKILDKHEKFWLYVDDAHGMSWAGTNGSGSCLSQIKLHKRMILGTSMAKGFGSAGGAFIFPNEEMFWSIKNWGGPLTHSGPQQPAVLGASIASAKIHLTNEIYELQEELLEKTLYCNKIMNEMEIPLIGDSIAPIFFVGLGLNKVGYNMVNRLKQDGFFVNLGIYPAVPETCTGLRFTVTRHHSFTDIENLALSISKNLPQALMEEERSLYDVYRAFRSVKNFNFDYAKNKERQSNFSIKTETTIKRIPKGTWNGHLGSKGAFDWDSLVGIEQAFSNNKLIEHNWEFLYYTVRDEFNRVVIMTFCTICLVKDDMLTPEETSRSIETERISNPYYLSTKTLMMGCPMTEGNHLYIDKDHPKWEKAFTLLLDKIWSDQDNNNVGNLIIRDIQKKSPDINDLLIGHGFIKADMPDSHVIYNNKWKDEQNFLSHLKSQRRNQLKKKVLKLESLFEINIIKKPELETLKDYYSLYTNVHNRSFEINSFKYPFSLFEMATKENNWEFIEIRLKNSSPTNASIAITMNYWNGENYVFFLIGMNYDYICTHNIYKQSLYQVIKRGIQLGAKNINLGFTTDFEKRKMGATAIPKVAYVQMKDHYNMSLIQMIPNTKI